MLQLPIHELIANICKGTRQIFGQKFAIVCHSKETSNAPSFVPIIVPH